MRSVPFCTRRALIAALSLVAGIALNGLVSCSRSEEPGQIAPAKSSVSSESYIPPPEGTLSLVQSLESARDWKGEVNVVGSLLLPSGTKLWVEIFPEKPRVGERSLAKSEPRLAVGGFFQAGPFVLPKAGLYRVRLLACFNGVWQSPEVLALVGSSGTKLPKSALEPVDPEFPQSGGRFEYWSSLNVAALSPEHEVIEAVKNAKLLVQGKGQAVDTIAEIVDYFDAPAVEFYPGGWSAEMGADGKWRVSLQHKWGTDEMTANWEYDPSTNRVKYLDPEAKMLSWIPAD